VRAFEEAVKAAARVDLEPAAERCGFQYRSTGDGIVLATRLLDRDVEIAYPSFEARHADDGSPVPPHVAALLAFHFARADGTPLAGEWISFAELPEGRFYVQAFRGYTGAMLVRRFGDDAEGLRAAALGVGGVTLGMSADVAVGLRVLPRISFALVYWAGDDEFEARADLLLDGAAAHQLDTDCYAVMGSWLTKRIAGDA
jgi:hypothetical protein